MKVGSINMLPSLYCAVMVAFNVHFLLPNLKSWLLEVDFG